MGEWWSRRRDRRGKRFFRDKGITPLLQTSDHRRRIPNRAAGVAKDDAMTQHHSDYPSGMRSSMSGLALIIAAGMAQMLVVID